MFICMRSVWLYRAALALICVCSLCLAHLEANDTVRPVFHVRQGAPVTIIVDPGHGGMDGGAVSPEGVTESNLNLEIALQVNDLLRFLGQRTDMTRREDISIHDPTATTIRAQKASDLKNRVALVNGTENAVLLSIHQNSLPSSPVTHGAQAFWNGQEGGEAIAKAVQEALNTTINTKRPKEAKSISSGVYLMKHTAAPGILVECGFLSNGEETALLQTPAHQRTLTCAIVTGLLRGMAGEEGP